VPSFCCRISAHCAFFRTRARPLVGDLSPPGPRDDGTGAPGMPPAPRECFHGGDLYLCIVTRKEIIRYLCGGHGMDPLLPSTLYFHMPTSATTAANDGSWIISFISIFRSLSTWAIRTAQQNPSVQYLGQYSVLCMLIHCHESSSRMCPSWGPIALITEPAGSQPYR
jgi:hypothetical protein